MIRLDIVNDGTGDEVVGNYDVLLYLPTEEKTEPNFHGFASTHARVEHHTRSNGWDALVLLSVAALKEKVGKE